MRPKTDECEKVSLVTRRHVWTAVVLLPLALSGCSDEKVSEVPVRPVKVMVVPKPVTERALTYSGVIAPRIESTLGFRVSGKIIERFVNVGDTVKGGQKIAGLDEKDLKLAGLAHALPSPLQRPALKSPAMPSTGLNTCGLTGLLPNPPSTSASLISTPRSPRSILPETNSTRRSMQRATRCCWRTRTAS